MWHGSVVVHPSILIRNCWNRRAVAGWWCRTLPSLPTSLRTSSVKLGSPNALLRKKKRKVFWHSYVVLIVLNVHNVQWVHLKFTNNFALTECLFWQINNLWQAINYISFNMTFCSGWAHPLKWARNKEFSAGRKIGPQPSSKPLSSGWVSIKNKDMISNPYWSWIYPVQCRESRLSPKIQWGCSGSPLYPFLSEYFAARQGCCAGIAVTSCILLWLPRPHRSPLPAKALG